MGLSVDCFGTLVSVARPEDPADAVATALERRGVSIPDEWSRLYGQSHASVEPGREYPLPAHVADALAAGGVTADAARVEAAVRDAFRPDADAVRTCEGAESFLVTARESEPVGVLSNCSVPGLVADCLDAAGFDVEAFDATVTSVDCGWRKPHQNAFETVADSLGIEAAQLVHVGDDPATDGGVMRVGGEFVSVADRSLAAVTIPHPEGRS